MDRQLSLALKERVLPRPGVPMMPIEARFWSKVEFTDSCWLWTASRVVGYGDFSVGSRVDGSAKHVRAHRWAYGYLVGPIPEGLVIDHLCRVRHCVNPDHMEPVTLRENILRGVGVAAICAVKTHCKHGHAFDEANTYIYARGGRGCRACGRRAQREAQAKKSNSERRE